MKECGKPSIEFQSARVPIGCREERMDQILPSHRDGPRREQPSIGHSVTQTTTRRRQHNSTQAQSRHSPNWLSPSSYQNTVSNVHDIPLDQSDLFSPARKHFVAMTGEFVGTVLFLYFAEGATQIANIVSVEDKSTLIGLIYISCAFGFSLATTAWVFYRVSGGLFNPAVCTLCLNVLWCSLTEPGRPALKANAFR